MRYENYFGILIFCSSINLINYWSFDRNIVFFNITFSNNLEKMMQHEKLLAKSAAIQPRTSPPKFVTCSLYLTTVTIIPGFIFLQPRMRARFPLLRTGVNGKVMASADEGLTLCYGSAAPQPYTVS